MLAAGASEMSEQFRAIGLHGALILVPVSLAITAFAMFFAALRFPVDARAMTQEMASSHAPGAAPA